MNCVKNPISKLNKIKLGITLGDPSGIGPEILSSALKRLNNFKNVEFVVIGDKRVLDKFDFPYQKVSLIDIPNLSIKNFSFGKIKPEYGRAAIEYLEKAVELIKNKRLDCLVTLPITKASVNKAGFSWPGHTEFLADKFKVKDTVMMLMNRLIKVSLVTRHLPLKDVSKNLTQKNIYRTILITYKGLKDWFGIKRPKLAVASLNPHASDKGLFGKEEERVILPAIEKAKEDLKGLIIEGPIAGDTLFLKAKDKIYDAVISMYHDQALIALKLTDFSSGVNITLGLPFVRTSPLHGTALDIAGKNKASCLSLMEAIKVAINCSLNLYGNKA
jgi:4-hydroxythreonine-4-phosphate dehydrogenase